MHEYSIPSKERLGSLAADAVSGQHNMKRYTKLFAKLRLSESEKPLNPQP